MPRFTGDVEDPGSGVRHVIPAKANYKIALDKDSIPDRGSVK
jgi:hypothetical protein